MSQHIDSTPIRSELSALSSSITALQEKDRYFDRLNEIYGSATVNDCNDAVVGKNYVVYASAANTPSGFVKGVLITIGSQSSNGYRHQILFGSLYIYVRVRESTTWSAWRQAELDNRCINLGTVSDLNITGMAYSTEYRGAFSSGAANSPFASTVGGQFKVFTTGSSKYGVQIVYSDAGIKARKLSNGTWSTNWVDIVASLT